MNYSFLKYYSDKSFIMSVIISSIGELLYMGYTMMRL